MHSNMKRAIDDLRGLEGFGDRPVLIVHRLEAREAAAAVAAAGLEWSVYSTRWANRGEARLMHAADFRRLAEVVAESDIAKVDFAAELGEPLEDMPTER